MEVNASDTRNKADKSAKGGMAGKLANNIKELADNRALTGAHGEDKKVALPSQRCCAPFLGAIASSAWPHRRCQSSITDASC